VAHQLRERLVELRGRVEQLGLTVVVYRVARGAAATDPSANFLTHLRPLLTDDDALWIFDLDPRPDAAPVPGAVVLPLQGASDTSRRIAAAIVANLVFFPGLAAAEIDRLDEWRGRTYGDTLLVWNERSALAGVASNRAEAVFSHVRFLDFG
jgi:hypothetical protein